MQNKIGIIIVSYHNPEMTTRYVTQELPKLTTPYTLVVVNVASNYAESKHLADACGLCFVEDDHSYDNNNQGYLIWDEENLGYARGNNKGVKFLNTLGVFSHYLFSNDDIEIRDTNILDVLAEKMEELKDVGCIGPRIMGIDGHDQSPHDRYISPYRLIGWKLLPWLRKKKRLSVKSPNVMPSSKYTYWVCGAFMMVNADFFHQVNLFDEATFLYFEEVILSERFLQIGKRVYFDSTVSVVHYEGGSSNSSKKMQYERSSRRYYFRVYKKVNCLTLACCNFI